MATELHKTKKVQALGVLLIQRCGELGYELPPGDSGAELVADIVQRLANQLGVTTRTVLSSYFPEADIERYAGTVVRQMSELSAVMDEAPSVALDAVSGFRVLAALGMCARLAVNNHEHSSTIIVLRDTSDSIVHIGGPLANADDQTVQSAASRSPSPARPSS